MPNLNESDTTFDQATGDQHLAALDSRAVEITDMLRLARHVEGVGRFHLHAVGEFERLDLCL